MNSKKNKIKKKAMFFLLFFVIILVCSKGIFGIDWNESVEDFYGEEDIFYEYNVSKNVTDTDGNLSILLDTQNAIRWDNGSQNLSYSSLSYLTWLLYNSSEYMLDINSTKDNETGLFEIWFQAGNGGDTEVSKPLNYIINATNDKPDFTNVNSTYTLIFNLTESNLFQEYINGTDEEEHYPLFFEFNWKNNCTHAKWSDRENGKNCSLTELGMNLTNISDKSALINFTPNKNDIGTYWGNITVKDFGSNYTCPHQYCDSEEYEQNKTQIYSVKFNILSSLYLNISKCNNTDWKEGENLKCNLSIITRGEENLLNISSNASLLNFQESNIINKSWFFRSKQKNSSNFTHNIPINISLDDSNVGNWGINFTVKDIDSNETESKIIKIFVNNTEDNASIEKIPNLGKIYQNTEFYINAFDDDLLVPDKTVKNEKLFFNSNISWISINEKEIIKNKTRAKVFLNHTKAINQGLNQTNQTIKINVTDNQSYDENDFSVEILTDIAPEWNLTKKYFELSEYEDLTLNLSKNVSDEDGDNVSFYYIYGDPFPSLTNENFNSSSGIINFTPDDGDVGFHNLTIIATDFKLNSTEHITFNISNINDKPNIDSIDILNPPNATIDSDSNIIASEDNYTEIELFVSDEDLGIPQHSINNGYYNESLSLNLTIKGPNSSLFEFVKSSIDFLEYNQIRYIANFTPRKPDVGDYNITLEITDKEGSSDTRKMNLTIESIDHDPVLSNLTKQYSAVNKTFYYNINATDLEDINESTGNLTFSYKNLTGKDIFNQGFNSSTGEFNLSFNISHGGKYHLNVVVNDSQDHRDSEDFWIYVYDRPIIAYPEDSFVFDNLVEDISKNLTFNATHSVGDNLTYEFKSDFIKWEEILLVNSSNTTLNYSYSNITLRKNFTYYGNKSPINWNFTPNFSDETYGMYKNISLTVYPSNPNIKNTINLSTTKKWKTNITHKNHPVDFFKNIGDKQATYNQNINIDLKNHFSDVDYKDEYYKQKINFSINRPSPTPVKYNILSDWVLTISSSATTKELWNITAEDLNISNENISLSNVTSNTFEIEFTKPKEKEVPTSGSTTIKPVLLKLLFPGRMSMEKKDKIILPIKLKNYGEVDLEGITLNSSIAKNETIKGGIKTNFTKAYFSSIDRGEIKNTSLIIESNTNETGSFEITINATADDPEYEDWGKIYLKVIEEKQSEILEEIIFTEEYIASNPECLEINELVERARKYYEKGEYEEARNQTEKALNACKETVSNPSLPRKSTKKQTKYPSFYLWIVTISLFVGGIIYYSYMRMRFKKKIFGKRKI